MLYRILTLLILLLAAPAWGADYYVDAAAAAGGDGSLSTPWDSLDDISGGTFSPGDTIYLKGTFNENWINFPSSGDASNQITLTSYGSSKAVINRSIIVSSWSGTGPYEAAVADQVYMVFEDGLPTQKATSAACADGVWFWAADVLYYQPTTGVPGDHAVRFVSASYSAAFYSNGKSYLTIDNIEFRNNWYGIYATGTHNKIIVSNCDFYYNLQGVTHPTAANSADHKCFSSYFYRCGLGFTTAATDTTNYFSGVEFYSNRLVDIGTIDGSVTWATAYGAALDLEGFSGQNYRTTTVRDNIFTGGASYSIYFYTLGGGSTINNSVYRNTIESNGDVGLMLYAENTGAIEGNSVCFNIISNSGKTAFPYSFNFRQGNGTAQNYFYHNTIKGTRGGIKIQDSGSANRYLTVKNNIIDVSGYNVFSDAAVDATLIFGDVNLYASTTGTRFAFGNADKTYAEWQAAGLDVNAVVGDPLLNASFGIPGNSPAKDAGAVLYTYAAHPGDFLGAKVYGSAPDIGAIEYKDHTFGGWFFEMFIPTIFNLCASTNANCYTQP